MKHRFGNRIIPKLPLTRHVFNHVRWELNALLVRILCRIHPLYIIRTKALKRRRELSVNIGCGPFGKDGWINLDLLPMPKLWLRYDCRKHLPMSDKSVARIRCEHFFEHLDAEDEVPLFLESCLRCLRENGILRIVVPDAGRFLLAYQSGKKENWSDLGWDIENLPDGFKTEMNVINHIFRQCEEHRYAYDFETLAIVLEQAGFTHIVKSEFGISNDPLLSEDQPKHRPYSIYVEAIK